MSGRAEGKHRYLAFSGEEEQLEPEEQTESSCLVDYNALDALLSSTIVVDFLFAGSRAVSVAGIDVFGHLETETEAG